MPRIFRFSVIGLACAVATVAGITFASSPVRAQPAAPQAGGIEEVVVTARKREEDIQRVPESIVAISAENIKQQQITSTKDLQQVVPGFSVQSGQADLFTGLYSLRGLAMLNIGQNTDPTTATYVDGVYQGLSASNLGQEDIQSIQVAQGPQGTLFGRNSTGGAVIITHNLPSDQFEGWARAGYGAYNQYDAQGMINIPLGDGAAFRLTGGYLAHDGYGTATIVPGAFNAANVPDFKQFGGVFASQVCGGAASCKEAVSDMKAYNVLGTLELKPTSDLDIVVRAGYVKGLSHGGGGTLTYMAPLGVAAFEAGSELGLPGYQAAATTFLLTGGCGGNPPVNCPGEFATLLGGVPAIQGAIGSHTAGNPIDLVIDTPDFDRASKITASTTITWNVNSDLQLKSITGFVDGKRFLQQDLDDTSFALINSLQSTTEKLFTEELQAIGNALDDQLKYTFGFYYYHKDAIDNQAGFFAPALGLIPQSLFGDNIGVTSPSAFAQVTYAVTPEINVTGGVRYTAETKIINQQNFITTLNPIVNPGGIPLGTPTSILPFSSYDNNLSYLGEVDYSPVENVMGYFKTSDGFRSGGPQETAPPGTPAFKPEQVTDYEVGVKTQLFDNRLRLNADIYREVYKNVQQTLFFTSGGSLVNAVANIGDALIDGFELQAEAIPIDNLTVSGTFGLMDPRYTSVTPTAFSNGITVNSGFANVQRFSYTLAGTYLIPADPGNITLHLDWHWQSKTPEEPGFTFGPQGNGFTQQDPYGILNARVGFTPGNGDWEISLWGKNLTNASYYTYIFNSTVAAGDPPGTPPSPGGFGFINASGAITPRTGGFEVTWSFH